MVQQRHEGVTRYEGVASLYFRSVLRASYALANPQNSPEIRILDFGCGYGELSKEFPKAQITGFDIIPELSDVPAWEGLDFDVLIANHVFYCLPRPELESIGAELALRHIPIVFSDSLGTLLNRSLAVVSGNPRALKRKERSVAETIQVLGKTHNPVREIMVWGLTQVVRLEPKGEKKGGCAC